MHYGEIKNCDIANGEGVRVTLFVSGCTNHCEHCFQPQTWDFDYGQPFTSETEQQLLDLLAPPYIQGLTLLGGEPFEPENQRVLVPFVRRVRETYPQKTVWAFSGFTLEELRTEGSHPRCEATDELLSMLDVLVDGRFVEALKESLFSRALNTAPSLLLLSPDWATTAAVAFRTALGSTTSSWGTAPLSQLSILVGSSVSPRR